MNKTAKIFFICLLVIYAQNTVIITQPAVTNFPENKIEYYFANFGVIHYNKPMTFSIFSTNSSLCNETEEPPFKPFTVPTYMVVNQGSCSYPKKALRAQSLGAQGIIFSSIEVEYSQGNVVVSDDGTGKKIKIAVLFISPSNGEKLGNLSNAKIKVVFEMKQYAVSSVDLFLSASGRQNYIFVRNLRQYYKKIQNNIRLNVVYHTFKCQSCSEKQCILQNNCCTFDFDHYKSDMGRYIVQQQFRQYKIFLQAQQNYNEDLWFQYMDQFDKNCNNDWPNSEACSQKIINSLGLSKLRNIDELDIMMVWRISETRTGIMSFPDVSVNGYKHTELLTAQSTFEMICSSLYEGTAGCSDQQLIQTSNKGAIIAAIVVSSIVFLLTGIFCYRRIIRREITNDMSSKVSELVSKYASNVSEQKKKRRDKLMERMAEQL